MSTSSVTIGVPGFALALGPNRRRYRPGFLRRVLRFAIPTGLVTGTAAYLGYRATRLFETHAGVDQGRTTATLIVLIVSLWTLMILARPITGWKLALVTTMIGSVAVIVAVQPLSHGVFLLQPTAYRIVTATALGLAGAALVELAFRAVVRDGPVSRGPLNGSS